jgi:serine/threonine protein kinase
MTSPSSPATPPTEPPAGPDHWRFEDTGAVCEWAEEFCPGGFHPVKLGDTFHNEKYRVIRKLGDGSYSTVWLAVNIGYVSLKLLLNESIWNLFA